MSTITRFLKFSIPFCLVTNIPLVTIHNTALAKPACYSNNIYQKKSLKCRINKTQKRGSLFSIYSGTVTTKNKPQIEKKKPVGKPFRQWNKNLSPTKFKVKLKTIHKNKPINLMPDRYPNFTLTSNGTDQHAITILSSVKLALVAKKPLSSSSIQSASLPNSVPHSLAALHLRCIENTTSVMFEFPNTKLSNAKASTEILYSIDNGKDRLLALSHSKGDNILGLWSGKKAVPFTNKLLDKSSLRINVWDADSVEYTFSFDVNNLGEAIHNLRSACNW